MEFPIKGIGCRSSCSIHHSDRAEHGRNVHGPLTVFTLTALPCLARPDRPSPGNDGQGDMA